MNARQVCPARCQILAWAAGAAILAIQGAASCSRGADPEKIQLGRKLFEHKWVSHDAFSPRGDGLGPMYNANACAACHYLGGVGGAGDAELNVDVLSMVPPRGSTIPRAQSPIRANAGKVHPAFSADANSGLSVFLHRNSTEPDYERWRLALLGYKLPPGAAASEVAEARRDFRQKQWTRPPVTDLPRKQGLAFRLSERNTPALFGAGLIDTIQDSTLVRIAEEQAKKFPGITGRVGRTSELKVGRFGWRGQVPTLREFVLQACATELGLQNPGHAQAVNPVEPKEKPASDDLTPQQCDALVEFVASLPPPRALPVDDEAEARDRKRGAELYDSIGCAACHISDVGDAKGLYSDLLLHDMGWGLEDPSPSFPERFLIPTSPPSKAPARKSGYGGGRVDEFEEFAAILRREWRTPPLWGVRHSGPYLHDGRANTIQDAIVAHGGEAKAAAKKFRELDPQSRGALLEFVHSLGAPVPEGESAAREDAEREDDDAEYERD